MKIPLISQPPMTRRRALRTMFCSSAALGLNLATRRLGAAETNVAGDRHLLVLGDFGSADKAQEAVARTMCRHVETQRFAADALWLLGDNFYKNLEGGADSARWRTGFEDMYPAATFPGPCWAILGNHDYVDTIGGDVAQLDYAKKHLLTRWHMPAKWYRVDWPTTNPLVTFLALDSNFRSINEPMHKQQVGQRPPFWLSEDEEKAQDAWLLAELAKPRTAPFLVCVGHHPVFSNGASGDTAVLVKKWADLFQKHGVHLYLCGHDHDLQHLELENRKTSFVISGGGGARLTNVKDTHHGVFAQAVYGFSQIQANPQRLIVRHLDANGKQVHAFSKTPDGTVGEAA